MSRQWLYIIAGFGGLLLIGAIVLVLLFLSPVVIGKSVNVGPNERGVVLAPYEPSGEILEPGQHRLKPGEEVQIIVVSQQTYVMSATSSPTPDSVGAKTSDGHEIEVDVSVVYAVDPNKLFDLFIKWRDQYQVSLVRPLTRSITRDILSRYSADALIRNKRSEAQQTIRDKLKAEFAKNDLIFFDYVILDIRQSN
jgi:regulator of protease activity HflC (stomatin/prohibitin superfamily)